MQSLQQIDVMFQTRVPPADLPKAPLSANRWHWMRRIQIMRDHPEVKSLQRKEPRTPLLMCTMIVAHLFLACSMQQCSLLVLTALAATLGAYFTFGFQVRWRMQRWLNAFAEEVSGLQRVAACSMCRARTRRWVLTCYWVLPFASSFPLSQSHDPGTTNDH